MEKLKGKINRRENQIIFWLDSKIYPLEAIYSAAYVFIDRAYIYLDGNPAGKIKVSLKGKEKFNQKQPERLEKEFRNELLNYLLRVEIAKRNRKIREFIVGTALISSLGNSVLARESGLTALKVENSDWQKDPLGIAIPWEDKYGKKAGDKKKKTKK